MFLDQSKYRQPTSKPGPFDTSPFKSTNGSSMQGSFSASCSQFDFDNTESPKHICPVCNKTFRASSLLDIHMRVHVGAKPFVCPVCNHRATQKGNLKLHMKKHHGRDLPTYIDLIPDSGIWGNFAQSESLEEMQLNLANKKKSNALAHSSLLNKDVVELIKKCQNNIGQSAMGRITESLKDFLDMAQQNVHTDEKRYKTLPRNTYKQFENVNSNNNGGKMPPLKKESPISLETKKPIVSKQLGFDDKLLTEQDMSIDANGKQFCFCKICGWKTTSAGYLNVHMRKHKAESHVCTICGRGFKETWYLKNHMRSHIHSLTSDVESLYAENRMANLSDVVNPVQDVSQDTEQLLHELNDKKADSFMCSLCGLVFPKDIYEEHLDMCGVVKQVDSDCKVCKEDDSENKETFFDELGLTKAVDSEKNHKHIKNFNSLIGSFVVYSPNANDSDKASTASNDTLLSLKKEIEDSIQQHGIEATKKSFNELMKNPNFKMLMTPEQLQSFLELFETKNAVLKKDSNVPQSSDSGPSRCPTNLSRSKPYRNAAMQSLADIGKSLTASKIDADQISTTATENDPQGQGYQCQFCLKWFRYRSVLNIHIRSHTGERPYKCSFCNYAGTQHNCLKLHMQRHHKEEFIASLGGFKSQADRNNDSPTTDLEQEHMLLGQAAKFNPAKCPICARVSPSPGYLKIHMRSHKQSLDHQCPICGRGFKEYWYLATHLRTHDQGLNTEQFQSIEKNNLTPHSKNNSTSSYISTTPNNVMLTKQHSLPTGRPVNHTYTSSTSSWSPLNAHEDSGRPDHMRVRSQGAADLSRPYVSKRKAFQPSRYRAEPYSPDESSARSRKSKPRKLSQGSYLAPVFQQLPSISDNLEDDYKVSFCIILHCFNFHALDKLHYDNTRCCIDTV